jgi:hypothetical protein
MRKAVLFRDHILEKPAIFV